MTTQPGFRQPFFPMMGSEEKEKEKEGLLPVGGLSILKADSQGAAPPCHADVAGDLARRVTAPATKAAFYWVNFP